MRAILNIDMAGLTLPQVWESMASAGIVHGGHSRHNVRDFTAGNFLENEWDTLAVYVALQDGQGAKQVDVLARLLGQNCIAMYDLDWLKGDLVGPDTSKYQPFDAGLFRVV